MQLPGPSGRLHGMRRTAPLLVALAMVAVAHLWIPQPVAACSCMDPAATFDNGPLDPGASVFTAVIDVPVAAGIPFRVTRWFAGIPPAGPALLSAVPGDGANCGTSGPPPGGEYLFVTYASEIGRYAISSCSLQADVDSPDGIALLAKATRLYGPGVAPPTEPPPPVATAPAPVSEPSPLGLVGTVAPVAVAIAFGVGLLGGLALILRRRRDIAE